MPTDNKSPDIETIEETEIRDDTDRKLDDIMLAMDVVDTLRHDQFMLEKELASEDRRAALIQRLKNIYKAQGIEVPESVLMDGVLALEEQRFAYAPPKKGWGVSLAHIYINRHKWLPMMAILGLIITGAYGINYFGFERPQRLETHRIETLFSKTLPANLNEAHQKIQVLAKTDNIKDQATNIYNLAQYAIENRDIDDAEQFTQDLQDFATDLSLHYTVRIVSRPGEYSGVFRINDSGEQKVQNYYLIVEAITSSGTLVDVRISSEEDQQTKRTSIWGVRVPQSEFNKVAADKKDDQIIQNAIIGEKKRGYLEPQYTIKTSGGKILDW